MDEHLSVELMKQVARGGVPDLALLDRVLSHLKERCACCAAEIEAFELAGGALPAAPAGSEPYGEVFERVLGRLEPLRIFSPASADELDERADRYLALPSAQRTLALSRDESMASFGFWQALVDRSLALAPSARSEELASLALDVAASFSAERYGRGLGHDCRALTWTATARARMMASGWSATQAALAEAEHEAGSGSGDPCVAAEIHLVRAGWLAATSGPEREAAELERAAELYRQAGEPHLEGEAQLRLGLALAALGDEAAAARALDRGLFTFTSEADPELFARAAAERLELLGGRSQAGGPSGEVH